MDLRVSVFRENVEWWADHVPAVPTSKVSLASLCADDDERVIAREHGASVEVLNADTLDTALQLVRSRRFVRPLVLNMADKKRPGGCVLVGAGMQEESLFRRTNLHAHLRPELYPIEDETEALYSKGVHVFRLNEDQGYAPFRPPVQMDFVSLPALSIPRVGLDFRLRNEDADRFRAKINLLLALGRKGRHDVLVLGALGCGAFGCPAKHVAELFRERIEAKERHAGGGSPRHIVFAILGKNRVPFEEVFSGSASRESRN